MTFSMTLQDTAQWIGIVIALIGAFFALRREWRERSNLNVLVRPDSYFSVLSGPETQCWLDLIVSNLSTSDNSIVRIRVTTEHSRQSEGEISLFDSQGLPLNLPGRMSERVKVGAQWGFRHEGGTLPVEITIVDSSGKSYSRSVELDKRY